MYWQTRLGGLMVLMLVKAIWFDDILIFGYRYNFNHSEFGYLIISRKDIELWGFVWTIKCDDTLTILSQLVVTNVHEI